MGTGIFIYMILKEDCMRQLTKGAWVVTDLLGMDADKKNAYFISTISSPLDRQVCKVDLLNGEVKVLTTGAGIHSAKVSFSGKYLIDEYSSLHIPREINLIQSDGKKIKTLLHAADPLKDYKLAQMEIFTIKAADQKTDLYCRIVKPLNFDPSKKYPVIVYVYGGPHEQLITNRWLGGGKSCGIIIWLKRVILFLPLITGDLITGDWNLKM